MVGCTRGTSWNRIRAIARRHYYVMLRSPHRLFDVSIWPLVDVLLFGSIRLTVLSHLQNVLEARVNRHDQES